MSKQALTGLRDYLTGTMSVAAKSRRAKPHF